MREKRYAHRILVGNPERKKPLGRPRNRSENNIRIDLKEIGWGGMYRLIWARIGISGGLL
jgi:hypothetical protein